MTTERVQIGWWAPGLRGQFSDHLYRLIVLPVDAFVDDPDEVIARPVFIDLDPVGGEGEGSKSDA